jgi:hypothetical protein
MTDKKLPSLQVKYKKTRNVNKYYYHILQMSSHCLSICADCAKKRSILKLQADTCTKSNLAQAWWIVQGINSVK